MSERQCPSCGGICKKSGCERENVSKQKSEQVLSDEEILRIASKSSPELVWMIKSEVVAGEFRRSMIATCRAIEKEVMGRTCKPETTQPAPEPVAWKYRTIQNEWRVTPKEDWAKAIPIDVIPLYAHPSAQPVSQTVIDNAWRALKLAMTICDLVPSHAHEHEDGPLKNIAKLVNVDENGTHGYAFIRDSLNDLECMMRNEHTQPISRDDVLEEIAQWIAPQRIHTPAHGWEFASAIRALKSTKEASND